MMETQKRVCAVILTFKALTRVQKCLNAVLAQSRLPERILVVDNHSEDSTGEYLKSLSQTVPILQVHTTSENLGPAGGFQIGMSLAYDQGFDFLWLLDDDSIPAPDCLEILLKQLGESKNLIAWPRNIDEKGNETDYPAWRGELLPREVIEKGGFPNKDLFWGEEDTEYFNGRLRGRHNIRRMKIQQAVVQYTQENLRKNATWHYYYLARNKVYYRLWVQRPRKIRRLCMRLLELWGRALFKEEHKLKKSVYFFWGIWHGLRGRIGKTIDPAAESGARL